MYVSAESPADAVKYLHDGLIHKVYDDDGDQVGELHLYFGDLTNVEVTVVE